MGGRLIAQNDILCYREILHQHEMLMNHADPVSNCYIGILDICLFTAYVYLAFIGLIQTVQHIHQCTFSRPIFTQKGMDAALLYVQFHVL